MYSSRFLNRLSKTNSLCSFVNICRHHHTRNIKYFLTKQVRIATNSNKSQVVSKIFCREYTKKNTNPTESLTQKSQEEVNVINSEPSNNKIKQNATLEDVCVKWCEEQSNKLNFDMEGSNKEETVTIIADKYDFCRAVCFLKNASRRSSDVTATISPAKSLSSSSSSSSSESDSLLTSPPRTNPKLTSKSESSLPSPPRTMPKSTSKSESSLPSPPRTKSESPSKSELSLPSPPRTKSNSTSESSLPVKTVAPTTPRTKSNSRERLIDKLTDEEIEEICRTKCRGCQIHPITSNTNTSNNRVKKFSDESIDGFFSSGEFEAGYNKRRLRRMGKMRMQEPNQQFRKMIPPANFLNHPQSSAISRQRIIHSKQKTGKLSPNDIRYNKDPRSVMNHGAPRIQFKSKYERTIRSREKPRRIPLDFRSKLGYVRIPNMPSNEPLNFNVQRPSTHASMPINPILYVPENIVSPKTLETEWNNSKPNAIKTDATVLKSETNMRIPNMPSNLNIQRPSTLMPNNPNICVPENMVPPKTLQTDWSSSKRNAINTVLNLKSEANVVKQLRENDFKLSENRSVLISGPGILELITSQYPQLRDDKDIIIRMKYVILTDADARHYLTGKDNPYSVSITTAGRTGTGTVIEIGSDVHNVKPGDKVLIKPVSCGKCSLCLSDRSRLCENVDFSRSPPQNGTLSRFYVHSSEFVTKISRNVNMINAAITTTTLSSAIRACQKAKVTAGDNVMVIDGGPLGTATALSAQSMGATSVCLADMRKPILENALKLGIDRVFLIDPNSPFRNTAIKIWEQIGDYPRLIFDCTGSKLTNQIAICATRAGGKAVLMKNDGNEMLVSITNAIMREVDIIISTIGTDESEHAAIQYLNGVSSVLINSDLCHRYDLSNVNEAFQHLLDPNRLRSNVIVECRFKSEAEKEKKDDDKKEQ